MNIKKKVLLVSLVVLLITTSLIGCSNGNNTNNETTSEIELSDEELISAENSTVVERTYFTDGVFDEQGWKPEIIVTFINGDLAEVIYDEVDKDNNSKRESDNYNSKLKEEVGITANEAFNKLEDQILDKGRLNTADVISGVTHSSQNFNKLIMEIKNDRENLLDRINN